MKKKNAKRIALLAALVGVLTAGGIMAYFTDADTVTNEFTVGKISLDLQEPEWNPTDGKDMTPQKTVKKNPQILNDGVNSEFVFIEVIMPYANVVTANADGTKNPATDIELFNYTVNAGWTELVSEKVVSENTVRHLYVWGTDKECTVLAKDITTGSLFDTVTMANIVEDQGLEEMNPEILINAYGIQTTDLDGDKTSPTEVWKILEKQAPSTKIDEPEDSITDVKESNKATTKKEQESQSKDTTQDKKDSSGQNTTEKQE